MATIYFVKTNSWCIL